MPSHPKIREINAAIVNKDHVAMKHLLQANPDIDPKNHIHYAVQVSSEPVVRTLLEHPKDFQSREAVANHIQVGDDSGDTPLSTTLQREDLGEGKKIVKTLLQSEFRADPHYSAPRGLNAMESLQDDMMDTEAAGDEARLAHLKEIHEDFKGTYPTMEGGKRAKKGKKGKKSKTAKKSKKGKKSKGRKTAKKAKKSSRRHGSKKNRK